MTLKKTIQLQPKAKNLRQQIKVHQRNLQLLIKRVTREDALKARPKQKIIQTAEERLNCLELTLNSLVTQILDLTRQLFAAGQ